MSLLPCITQANPNVALYGSGGGGGGSNYPANPNFSTVTMNGPVNMEWNTISLAPTGQYQIYATSNDSNMYLVCASTNQIRIGTQDAADSLYVGTSNVVAKYNFTAPQMTGISSINGSVYPPAGGGGYTATKINWLNAGVNVLPPTMPSSIVLTSATTPLVNGHTYRVTASVGLSNSGLSGSTSLFIEGNGTPVGGLPVVLYQDDNLLTAGSTPWYGYTTYFTCSGGGASGIVITGQNSGTSNTTVLSDQGYFIFEDMGII